MPTGRGPSESQGGDHIEPLTDKDAAAEIAEVLMRQALAGGPLARIRDLTRLLRILRIVAQIVTARRDREAYAIAALWPQRGSRPDAKPSPHSKKRPALDGRGALLWQLACVVTPAVARSLCAGLAARQGSV